MQCRGTALFQNFSTCYRCQPIVIACQSIYVALTLIFLKNWTKSIDCKGLSNDCLDPSIDCHGESIDFFNSIFKVSFGIDFSQSIASSKNLNFC